MLLGLGLLGPGCNERPVDDDPIPAEVRAYARHRCATIDRCACPNATTDEPAECEARIVEIYQETVEGREGIQLGCFSEGAERWRTADCEDPPENVPCSALAPLGDVGTPCRINPFQGAYVHADSCAEGLWCVDDRCVEPVVGGEPGDPCSPEGLCDRSLTCIAGLCQPRSTEGGACDRTENCTPIQDLYCAEGVCTPRTMSGESCETRDECRSGVPCLDGRCTPIEPRLCLRGGSEP